MDVLSGWDASRLFNEAEIYKMRTNQKLSEGSRKTFYSRYTCKVKSSKWNYYYHVKLNHRECKFCYTSPHTKPLYSLIPASY